MSRTSTPRWKSAIENALQKGPKSNVYQLSTTDIRDLQIPPGPRARTVVHRTFISPISPDKPLLVTSTDIRTPKARQIAQNPRVELAWWFSETDEQFRISGHAYILPSRDFSVEDVHGAEPGTVTEGEAIQIAAAAEKLREAFKSASLAGPAFDWEAERIKLFDNMSAHMKASWFRPVPGSPLPGGYGAAKKWPEKLEEDKEGGKEQVATALKNFALVVIDPIEVDYVELGVTPNQRTLFKKVNGDNGTWGEEILVP